MSRSVKRIQGSLTQNDGGIWHVDLYATIVALHGQHGIEDGQVGGGDIGLPVREDQVEGRLGMQPLDRGRQHARFRQVIAGDAGKTVHSKVRLV